MALQGISGAAVAAAGAGALLIWSGIRGRSVTGSLRALISGQAPPGAEVAPLTAGPGGPSTTGAGSPATGGSGSAAAAPAHVSGNTALARLMAASYGWGTGSQWNSLYALWTQESGFNNEAANPSGAFGIPQALPYSKMPKAAWPRSAGGSASASAQIAWGLKYIKDRYGSPNNAWGGYWARGGYY